MMYRLKNEKSRDDREAVRIYAAKAREALEAAVKGGQTKHPDFGEFAFSLCQVAARMKLRPEHTAGMEPRQIGVYGSLIRVDVARAVELAPQIGLDADEVQALYRHVLGLI